MGDLTALHAAWTALVDAGTAPVNQVLRSQRDTLLYTYDLGDDWGHRIALLGVEDAPRADGGGALPRCAGVTVAAPLDDSGGVVGWPTWVQEAHDPASPEHDDAREWLGLAAGERFDPAGVDVEECDRRPAWLR